MTITRVGHGYDVHALEPGDGILLGGVPIACDKSIVAHSDGDILIHALCDALLGAQGASDIGQMFPNDASNKNRDSREFLCAVGKLLAENSYHLGNADITIIAQAPRMAPHIDAMKRCLSQDLNCEATRINIKATTTDKLGFIGREEGIAVEAVVLLGSD